MPGWIASYWFYYKWPRFISSTQYTHKYHTKRECEVVKNRFFFLVAHGWVVLKVMWHWRGIKRTLPLTFPTLRPSSRIQCLAHGETRVCQGQMTGLYSPSHSPYTDGLLHRVIDLWCTRKALLRLVMCAVRGENDSIRRRIVVESTTLAQKMQELLSLQPWL